MFCEDFLHYVAKCCKISPAKFANSLCIFALRGGGGITILAAISVQKSKLKLASQSYFRKLFLAIVKDLVHIPCMDQNLVYVRNCLFSG